MKKLIRMTDYCQQVSGEFMVPKKPFDKNYWFGKILNYSDFLRQPLELWMFVPCDENGNVLNDMSEYPAIDGDYKKAKERCLFDGFRSVHNKTKNGIIAVVRNNPNSWSIELGFKNTTCKYKFIEDLVEHNPQLTETSIKQLAWI